MNAPATTVRVTVDLTFDVSAPALLALQVVAAAGRMADLVATSGGRELEVRDVRGPEPYSRQQVLRAPEGRLEVRYDATIGTGAAPLVDVDPGERLVMLRPSRYCPADRLTRYTATRLPGPDAAPGDRVRALADHVHQHLAYAPGSTGPTDDAVDVLLAGQGVCRDFAHLVVTLARAQGLAARFVSVYAPGLAPMDFHAVAEVEADGVWHVVDATRLAPRDSLVRIATGRDAADTAFATTVEGRAVLVDVTVTAVAEDGLPVDDGRDAVRLT